MAENTERTLYGSTSEQGCVPAFGNASKAPAPTADGNADRTPAPTADGSGPTFSDDGRLILSESWTKCSTPQDAKSTAEKLEADFLVETWRIWDCSEQDWADCGITLRRYDTADLVVRESDTGMCVWAGAVNTRGRVLASRDREECNEKCWQWLREN